MIRRRRFLATIAGALFPDWTLLGIGSGFSDIFGDRELTPGRSVTVWCRSAPRGDEPHVVHLLDGREVGRVRAPSPSGIFLVRLAVTPVPRGEPLAAGRHEFLLAWKDRRVGIGHIDVAPFHFGC